MLARGQPGELEGHFHRLGTTAAEKCVLHIAGSDHGDQLCEVSAERVHQLLTVQGIAVQLGLDRLDDFRIAVAGSIDSVPPEAIDEPGAVHISEGLFRVLPLDEGGIRGHGLAIQQPARIDVLIEVVHRVVDDAFLFFLVEFGLQDVVQHPTRLVENLFLAATHRSLLLQLSQR